MPCKATLDWTTVPRLDRPNRDQSGLRTGSCSHALPYSAFTYYTGPNVNSGEYKLMGLAPYGEPRYTYSTP